MPVVRTAANSSENLIELSEEEAQVLLERKKAQETLLATEKAAKYKVEVLFSKKYSWHSPVVGALTFWESGTKLHGGGDVMMYICPGKSSGRNTCEAFIPEIGQSGTRFLVCPKCFTSWKAKEVTGQILLKLPLQTWAEVLHKHFNALGGDADLVMKYYPGGLRTAAEQEQSKQRFGEEFGKIRGQRIKRVYPLRNIIKDTAAGADLGKRILAFLRA